MAGLAFLNCKLLGGMTIPLTLGSWTLEFPEQGLALLALIPIWLYNGRQGAHNKAIQYACYAFYPAHMLILALLLAFDAINGDPLSQQWAIYRAIRYAEKLYPEETFHWDQRTAADGQFFHYVVYVQSDQSRDTNFAVQTRFWLLTKSGVRSLSQTMCSV